MIDKLNSDMASAFEGRLMSLKEWPEKRLIFELTNFAEYHYDIAPQVVEIIVGRLASVSILSAVFCYLLVSVTFTFCLCLGKLFGHI